MLQLLLANSSWLHQSSLHQILWCCNLLQLVFDFTRVLCIVHIIISFRIQETRAWAANLCVSGPGQWAMINYSQNAGEALVQASTYVLYRHHVWVHISSTCSNTSILILQPQTNHCNHRQINIVTRTDQNCNQRQINIAATNRSILQRRQINIASRDRSLLRPQTDQHKQINIAIRKQINQNKQINLATAIWAEFIGHYQVVKEIRGRTIRRGVWGLWLATKSWRKRLHLGSFSKRNRSQNWVQLWDSFQSSDMSGISNAWDVVFTSRHRTRTGQVLSNVNSQPSLARNRALSCVLQQHTYIYIKNNNNNIYI